MENYTGTLIKIAIRELRQQELAPTFSNISSVVARITNRREQDIEERLREVISIGVMFGFIERNGEEFDNIDIEEEIAHLRDGSDSGVFDMNEEGSEVSEGDVGDPGDIEDRGNCGDRGDSENRVDCGDGGDSENRVDCGDRGDSQDNFDCGGQADIEDSDDRPESDGRSTPVNTIACSDANERGDRGRSKENISSTDTASTSGIHGGCTDENGDSHASPDEAGFICERHRNLQNNSNELEEPSSGWYTDSSSDEEIIGEW